MISQNISEEAFKVLFDKLKDASSPEKLRNSQSFLNVLQVADNTLAAMEENVKKFRKDTIEKISELVPQEIYRNVTQDQILHFEREVQSKMEQLNRSSDSKILEHELNIHLKQLTNAEYQMQKYLKDVAERLNNENTNLSKTFQNALERYLNIITIEVF